MTPSQALIVAGSILIACASDTLLAQVPTRPPAEYVVEVVTQFRQMGARQQPRFTPFRETRYAAHIDSRRLDSITAHTTWSLRFEPATYVQTADLTTSRDGSVSNAVVQLRLIGASSIVANPGPPTASNNSYVEPTYTFRHAYIVLMPQARLWRFVPVVRSGDLRIGATWRDTLNFSSSENGFSQTLSGVRVSAVRGDTMVAGRRLWIISDSANVRVNEVLRELEYSVGTDTPTDRNLSGVIRGRYIFDPEVHLALQRHDTTHLSGTGTLRYPDGRTFTTALRQEQRQQTRLYTGTAYAAYQAELRAEQARARTGMLILPNTRDQERLSSGDIPFRDSLLSVWDASQDGDERARLYSLLSYWGNRTDRNFATTLANRAFAAGDTVAWLDFLTRSPLEASRWDARTIRELLIPTIADPAAALAFGVSRDRFYEFARGQLLTRPPAISPNPAEWGYPDSVYNLFAAMWTESREPRMRALGLLANVARNPRVWGDTLLANVNLSPFVLSPAAQLARGVGATWPAASQQPMPPATATWRDWLEWMGGRSPNYVVPASIAARSNPRYPELRFEGSHVSAIKFYSARTGRDIVTELREANARATDDSAKLVYTTMLTTLGAVTLSPSELQLQVVSGSPLMLQNVRRVMPQMFNEAMRSSGAGPPITPGIVPANSFSVVRADSALSALMIDKLIESLLSGTQPWQPVESRVPGLGVAAPARNNPAQPTFTVVRDVIPSAVIEKWRQQISFATPAEVSAFDLRQQRTIYTVAPVFVAGQFAMLSYNYRGYSARAANEAPAGYAGGTTLYLMLVGNEWVVITQSTWVT